MRARGALGVLAAAACLIAPATAGAAPGDLDPEFGQYGIATTVPARAAGDDVRLTSDGGLIYVTCNCGDLAAAVAKTDADGALDPTFGEGGVASVAGASQLSGAALDAQGRIVVVGRDPEDPSAHPFRLLVARLTPSGEPDETFDEDGKVALDFGIGWDAPYDVEVAPNGRIIATAISNGNLEVVGIAENGKLDEGFAEEGVLELGTGYGASIEPDRDGGYLVARNDAESLVVTRITADGMVDPTYGEDGTARLRGWAYDDQPLLAVGPDGRTAVSTTSFEYAGHGFLVNTYLQIVDRQGHPDPGFDTSRALSVSEPGGAGDETIDGIEWDEEGQLLVSGSLIYQNYPLAGHSVAFIARFGGDGAADQEFADGGVGFFPYDFSAFPAGYIAGPVLRPDGRILATAGTSLVRFLDGGTLADADADGVPDAEDRCPRRSGTRSTGCQSTPVTLSVKYRRRNLTGEIKGYRECIRRNGEFRPVRIYRSKSGKDALVRTLTVRRGKFRTRLRPRGHTYYAATKSRHIRSKVDCLAGKSKRVP